MAFDYSALLTTANGLLAEFGRPVTLFRTPRTPADAQQPWNGPADWDDESPPEGHRLDNVSAVFVGAGETEFHDASAVLIRRGRAGFLVAGSVDADLTQFDRIEDDGQLWRIEAVNLLRPGSTVLLYGIEVSQ